MQQVIYRRLPSVGRPPDTVHIRSLGFPLNTIVLVRLLRILDVRCLQRAEI